MSTDDYQRRPIDPRAYDPARAEALALRHASGEPETSLSALHRADPDAYPPPVIVRRWRSVWPAFDALMRECEVARAAAMMDDTLGIADNVSMPAANAKNAIAVRWRMAEALAPEIFGQRKMLELSGGEHAGRATLADLSDAQLLAIARGRDPMALLSGPADGQAPDDPPVPPHQPPAQRDGGFTGGSKAIPPAHTFIPARTSTDDLASRRDRAVDVEPGVVPGSSRDIKNPLKTSG